ncbi:hypothetical protein HMPREF3033_01177 [Veillonellaceae bacterium DNF00751]|nr:hypothetical protein HMPREF3033_01177 [Veillonellaceae bacterium DNF00751]
MYKKLPKKNSACKWHAEFFLIWLWYRSVYDTDFVPSLSHNPTKHAYSFYK